VREVLQSKSLKLAGLPHKLADQSSLVAGYTFLSDGWWSLTRPSSSHLMTASFFVSLLNCSEFSSRLTKISQALYAITGIQFRVGSRGLDERWPLGSVCVSRCSNV
jgi:hypothetical protein